MMIPESTIELDDFKALTYEQCVERFGRANLYVLQVGSENHVITRLGYRKPSLLLGVAKGVVNAFGGFVDPADRLAVCKTCDMYNNGRCKLCGCFLEVKARIKLEQCPEGKW